MRAPLRASMRKFPLKRHSLIFGLLFYLAAGDCLAASGQTEYFPKSGQLGKDVVWVGNPDIMVQKMLDIAGVTPSDLVFDLGSGDGRN
ncbi:MAG TPA: hypothetical protein VNT76_14020, partial [Candidatus Binatus sp.]|nr:hypothetical protein [Candidatus Binatus sp.]